MWAALSKSSYPWSRGRIEIRLGPSGNPEFTIFVHDHQEQLARLVSCASELQSNAIKQLENLEDITLTLNRIGGNYDQTHYAITGITIGLYGVSEDDVRNLVSEIKSSCEMNLIFESGETCINVEIQAFHDTPE